MADAQEITGGAGLGLFPAAQARRGTLQPPGNGATMAREPRLFNEATPNNGGLYSSLRVPHRPAAGPLVETTRSRVMPAFADRERGYDKSIRPIAFNSSRPSMRSTSAIPYIRARHRNFTSEAAGSQNRFSRVRAKSAIRSSGKRPITKSKRINLNVGLNPLFRAVALIAVLCLR